MSKAALDKFGELIVQSLRDRTIAHYDGLANGHWKAPALIGLEQELQALDEYQRSIVRRCVISSIDVGIHDFLFHLQELGALISHMTSTWLLRDHCVISHVISA